MADDGQGLGASVLGVYCERGFDPSFWAEPANAITNLAFLAAGAVVLARRRDDLAVAALACVTLAIGVGSFLFHTLATRGAMLADVLPIQCFIGLYFLLALRRFFGLGAFAAVAGTAAFLVAASAAAGLMPPEEPWRGLGGYLGGLGGLVAIGGLLAMRRGESAATGRALLAVAALFGVSIVFRSADWAACPRAATGTHFLWHLANALVLYALMEILGRRRAETMIHDRHART